MRRLFTILISTLTTLSCLITYGQTGPGGVGDNSTNELWLKASELTGLINGDPVSNWTDYSGNSNDAVQVDGSKQPTYSTNQINGHPTIDFDGSNDFMTLGSNITSQSITTFIVYSQHSTGVLRAPLNLGSHYYFSSPNDILWEYPGTGAIRLTKADNSFSIISHNANSTTNQLNLFNGSTKSVRSFSSFPSITQSTIGASHYSGSTQYFFNGEFAEFIVYNNELNSAKRRIVSEYLGGKYNLTSESNLYTHGSTHGTNIIGIGQESDGSNSSARGSGQLLISSPSALSNGEYLFLGNDDGGFASSGSVGPGVSERWTQVWKSSVVGSPGTVSLEFFLNGNDLTGTDYVVLIDNDGDFTNGGTVIHETGKTYNATNDSWNFTNVNITDGKYITLGMKSGAIFSQVASGNWNSTSSWTCSCIPNSTQNVTVQSGHNISVDANSSAFSLTIEGSLDFSGNDSLFVYDQLTVTGSVSAGSGVIAAVKEASTQEFYNNGSSRLDLNRLYVSNGFGLNLMSGGWSISKSLQVSSGGLNVSSADSIVLLSTASETSEILPSMEDAFTGEFIIQRYVSSRPANFANFSSPISDGTVNDWDDDLLLSGVGGRSGTALNANMTTFYSIHSFTTIGQTHVDVDDITDPLLVGKGYEIYLASTISNFNGATIDYRGTPNVGEISYNTIPSPSSSSGIYFNKNWNLMGNPYHSPIDFDLIPKDIYMSKDYYIFNSVNGSYDLITQGSADVIAPSQGFWFFNVATGNRWLTFTESVKSSSNSSTFLREKKQQGLSLTLSDVDTKFQHKLQINIDEDAIHDYDELDRPYLPSPLKEVPAIYSYALNSTQKLIRNSISGFEESIIIPISIYSKSDSHLKLEASNIANVLDEYECVYLRDEKDNKLIDLTLDKEFEFSATEGNSDRFKLILSKNFKKCQISDETILQSMNSQMTLRNVKDSYYLDFTLNDVISNFEISVINLNGQEVINRQNFVASQSGSFPLHSLSSLNGVYVIRVVSDFQVITKKIKL